jgi:hypothetical protein
VISCNKPDTALHDNDATDNVLVITVTNVCGEWWEGQVERFEREGISCEEAVRLMTVCHVMRRHSEQFN